MDHPKWCSLSRCTIEQLGGTHESDPTWVDGMPVSLSVSARPDLYPVIRIGSLASPQPGEEYDWVFVNGQYASRLAATLSRFGDLAGAYARGMTSLVDHARELARTQLADELPRRWTHVQAVAAKAVRVAPILDEPDRAVLVASAWLHDVGYAKALATTGFHPLDGARFLRSVGFDERVTGLVAHHSAALIEADERSMYQDLADEFPREESVTADALWYCDMTTGPDGQDFVVTDRLDEIRSRYGPRHMVTRFINRAQPEIESAVRRTQERLASAAS